MKKQLPLEAPWPLIIAFLILALALILLSLYYFAQQKETIRDNAENELAAISGFRSLQVSHWRDERLLIACSLSEGPYFSSLAAHLIENPNDEAMRQEARAAFASLQKTIPFKSAAFVHAGGTVILSYPETADYSVTSENISLGHRAWKNQKPLLSDFYEEPDTGTLAIRLIIPLLIEDESETASIALMSLTLDPAQTLYPLLQYWPTAEPSPETLLLRREGTDFLYLSPPLQKPEALFSTRVPISDFRHHERSGSPGEEGLVEGKDYLGRNVVGYIGTVPDSPWLLLTTTDFQDIYGGMLEKYRIRVFLTILCLIICGTFLGAFWYYERAARDRQERTKWDESKKNMYEFLQIMIDIMPNPAFFKNPEGKYEGCNAAFEKLLGLPKNKILQKTVRELASSEIAETHQAFDDALLKEPGHQVYEAPLKAWDGEHHIIFIKTTYLHPDGSIGGLVGILKDITQRIRAEEEIDQLRKFSDGTIQTMTEGLVLTDPEGKFTFVNPAAASILGYSPREMINQKVRSFVPEDQYHKIDEADARRAEGKSDRYELDFFHRDGSRRTLLVSGGPRVQGQKIGGTLAVLTDITERKTMEEEIRALSLTDPLTKLYNRRGFTTLADQQLKTASRMNKKVVLLYMDVDNLKLINDTWGHKSGDKALFDVADTLKKNFRESDILARVGGDEFVVLAMETADMNAETLIKRLREKIALYNEKSDAGFELSISIGRDIYIPESASTIEDMIARADVLMYEEKRNKKKGSPS